MESSTAQVAVRQVADRVPHVPIRTCVACRCKAPKPSLVRLVVSGNAVQVDGDAPGRGAYVCADPECVRHALRGRGVRVARALRREHEQIVIDEEAVAAAAAAGAHGDPRREE